MKNIVLNAIFPKTCSVCGKFGTYLCGPCSKKFVYLKKQLCAYCEKESLNGQTHPYCLRKYGIDRIFSLFEFNEEFRRSLHVVKYRSVREVLHVMLGQISSKSIKQIISYSMSIPLNAALVPIPLHPYRLKDRGFNQAEIIAQAISIWTGRNVETDSSFRCKNTPSLASTKYMYERYQFINNAFVVEDSLREDNHPIILVDDVWTTGATIKELASQYKRAGVQKVYAITLARRVVSRV